MSIQEQALKLHKELKGKIKVNPTMEVLSKEDLSLVYTPGVAAPCLEIQADKNKVYDYTWKGNTVAVITDGSAVLGLGDIGPEASLPVMEGKASLFNRFAGINAIPIALDTHDTETIIQTVKLLAPNFGGINLEDISAPRCVEIERRLEAELDIPIFHDDQHGTAIVVLSALINALKIVDKNKESIRVVVSGTGAAGSAIIKLLHGYGIQTIQAFDHQGQIGDDSRVLDEVQKDLLEYLTPNLNAESLASCLEGADVFIGVSAANLLTSDHIARMAPNAIVFAMANPNPEIAYDDAKSGGARVVGTGRSDRPNQINNVLVFPGLFRGLLDCRSTSVPIQLRLACAEAIASLISEDALSEDFIITDVFDDRLVPTISETIGATVATLRNEGYKL